MLTPAPGSISFIQDGQEKDKIVVQSSIIIDLLSSFDAVAGKFSSEFTVFLKWFDERLKFNNLELGAKNNLIKPEEAGSIWFPNFIFENTHNKRRSMIDKKSIMYILRKGDGQLSDIQYLENKYIYHGDFNAILYERYYHETFDCHYHLHWYPFDTQVCYIDIKPASELEEIIHFQAENFEYKGPIDITEFTLKAISMEDVGDMLRVTIIIQRKLLSLVLRIFIPTIILNIIGHMSNYYKDSNFVGLMTLNVTVTLVLTTMFLSISTRLPPTAYIKMIDVWLLFNLFKPFIDIIVNTYIENLRDIRKTPITVASYDSTQRASAWQKVSPSLAPLAPSYKLNSSAGLGSCVGPLKNYQETIDNCKYFLRIIYPVFYLIFVLFFWVIGLTEYYNS